MSTRSMYGERESGFSLPNSVLGKSTLDSANAYSRGIQRTRDERKAREAADHEARTFVDPKDITDYSIPTEDGYDSGYDEMDDQQLLLRQVLGGEYDSIDHVLGQLQTPEQKFKTVCDTLQVHTLKYTKSELAKKYLSYEEYAYDLGTEWIKRYSHLIERMKINVHLTRWGGYTSAPQYEDLKNEIQTLIKTKNEFQHLFAATAQITYDGFKKFGRLPNVSPEKANEFLSSSIEYLIEECAVVLLWKQYHERILLYPKSLGEALIKIMEYYWGRDRDFLKLLQIRFKKDGLFPSKIQKVALLQNPEIKIKTDIG